MKHIDIVKNDWAAGTQHRIGWFSADYWHLAVKAAGTTSSYLFRTEAHVDDECPFRENDTLPFVRIGD